MRERVPVIELPALDLPQRLTIKGNVLSRRECQTLIAIYDEHVHLSSQKDYCGNQVVHYSALNTIPEGQAQIRTMVSTIRRSLGLSDSYGRLYLESVFIAMLPPDSYHPLHADNEQCVKGKWTSNHTPQRDYSAILYLNSEFEGGELFFEALDVRIKPARGLLIGFPSHHRFIHGVDPVVLGNRYSISLWFTRWLDHSLDLTPSRLEPGT